MPRRSRRLIVAALLAAAVVPAGARAAPAPGCAGLAFTDKTGDSVDSNGDPAQPNLDIVDGFFLADGGPVTANIRVASLSRDVPDQATGIDWYMLWTAADGTTDFVRAEIESGADPAFFYGHVDDLTGGFADDGPTTGQLSEGPNGVVQVALPADLAKGTLKSPYAQADESVTIGPFGALNNDDTAPDDQKGTDFVFAPCPAAPPAGAPPSPAGGPPPAPASAPRSGLTLHVSPRGGSARTANRRHRLTVSVRSDAPVTRLTASLLASSGKGRALASGRLARLDGAGALRLRTRHRLRRGRYVLRITATAPDGRRASRRFPVVLTA